MQGRTRRTLIHTADAQASVLGFVIILGILLAATSLYLGFNVPKWTAEYEFAHEAKVERDFSDLSAAIDLALVSEDPTVSSSIAIGMAPERVQLVGIFASGGTLQFDPQNERFVCVAALPNETAVNESEVSPWNSTDVNFPYYDKFHLDIFLGEGAKLQLEAGQNQIFDSGGNKTLNGEYWYNNFTVTNGTILHTHWLAIYAINIAIGPNSSILADGGGLFGGKYNEDGKGEGGGHAATSSHYSVGGGGAGFGGAGGNGGSSYYGTGGQGGSTFGNETGVALDAGSGGGGGNLGYQTAFGSYVGGNGGEGGGVVFLDAPIITISGNVSANGDDGKVGSHNAVDSAGGGGGGGSGGTILIKGSNITLHGMLSVRGGDGFDGSTACDYDSVRNNNGGGGGGGGGGRIKIYNRTELITLESDWRNHTDVHGGAGGLGGVGWRNASDPDCYGNPVPTPYPGGNGSHGDNGTASPPMHINYTESIPHYPSGYLISNVTATRGFIGYHTSNTSMIRYGTMTWGEYTPSGTNIALKVRTAMDANMTDALPWEECPEVTMGQNIADLPSVSNGHQYIQWRAELVTMDRSRTPTLKWVNISCEYGPPILMNATGNIEFGSQYLYYPDYKLIYEHGAIIKEPSQGKEFMLFPPPLIISQDTNNCTSLKISALNLIGNASSSSGAFSSSIDAYCQSSALRKGGLTSGLAYGNLTLTLTTEHSTAWKNWFNKTCKDAGLTHGNTTAGDYYFDESGNDTLNVIFTGTESKPVYLWLKYADARIEFPKLPKWA